MLQPLVDSKVNELELLLENQIKTTKTKLDSTSKYSSTSSSTNSTTNNEGETTTTHSSSSTINEEWTKLNNQYNTLVGINKDLSNQYKKIKDSLIQVSNMTSTNDQINALKEIKADAFITTYNYCIDTIQSNISPIHQLETLYYQIQTNQNMIENQCLTYEEIESIVQKSIPKNNSNLEYLSQISNIINEQISMYEKTPLYLEDNLNDYQINQEKLIALKESSLKAKKIQDFNILAYSYLNPSHSLFSKAIITFIFAIFIDTTTFLMPYFMNERHKNVLFMNKKKVMMNEEEIFIQMLESFYINDQGVNKTLSLIRNKLNEFLSLFQISNNQAIEDGYSYMCDEIQLNQFLVKNQEMIGFILYAMNIHYLYKDEKNIYLLENKVYLRTKFVLWIQNVMTSLSKYMSQSEGMYD